MSPLPANFMLGKNVNLIVKPWPVLLMFGLYALGGIILLQSCITINNISVPEKATEKAPLQPPAVQPLLTAAQGIVWGRYLRNADVALNGACTAELPPAGIEITNIKGNLFNARYYNIDNGSHFEGRIYENNLVVIIQTDPNGNYVAVFCGNINPNNACIIGTFYDNRGNAGDFEWIRQNK